MSVSVIPFYLLQCHAKATHWHPLVTCQLNHLSISKRLTGPSSSTAITQEQEHLIGRAPQLAKPGCRGRPATGKKSPVAGASQFKEGSEGGQRRRSNLPLFRSPRDAAAPRLEVDSARPRLRRRGRLCRRRHSGGPGRRRGYHVALLPPAGARILNLGCLMGLEAHTTPLVASRRSFLI